MTKIENIPILNICQMSDEERAKAERLQAVRQMLETIGESRDEVGSMARKQLAGELVQSVLDRHQGQNLPVDGQKTAALELRDRVATRVLILREDFRVNLQSECQRAIPPECKIKVRISERCEAGVLNVDIVDDSEWVQSKGASE